MRALYYATLGFCLSVSLCYVCAAVDAHQGGSIESIAMQVTGALPPPASAIEGSPESISPENMVQRMAQLLAESNIQQITEIPGQLTSEFSHLVEEAAASIGQSQEQVYRGVGALIRARTRRNPERPRFDIGSMVDKIYNDDTKRLFGRMMDLFREVVSAYVKSAASDAAAEASTSAAVSAIDSNFFSKLLSLVESSSISSLPSPSSSATAGTSSKALSSDSPAPTTASATASALSSQAQASTPSSSSSSSASTSSSRKTSSSKSHGRESTTSSEGDDDDDDAEDEDNDDGDEEEDGSTSGKPKKTAKGP
ncbi:hypothetical protein IWW37_002812 [Coemansia sp. RSA 2050]|nr:hypothetical protein IWW37_002812 [Coemansia sp. RSA 2050]